MFDELLLVLPAQRPASPEIAESPTLTTHGDPTPGPSACAAGAPIATVPPTSEKSSAPTASLCLVNPPGCANPLVASWSILTHGPPAFNDGRQLRGSPNR